MKIINCYQICSANFGRQYAKKDHKQRKQTYFEQYGSQTFLPSCLTTKLKSLVDIFFDIHFRINNQNNLRKELLNKEFCVMCMDNINAMLNIK